MTLGSPVGSPVQSPGSPGVREHLPCFLLGETNTPGKINLISSQDTPRHLHLNHSSLASPLSQSGTPDYRGNRQKAVFGNTNSPSTPQTVIETHNGGPPTRGLFDTVDSLQPASPYPSDANQSVTSAHLNQSRAFASPLNNSLFLESPLNPNANESQGLLQWVTVFGFPMSHLNNVLSHISSRVRIVDKYCAPNMQSNWIHLKCASEQEAQRALACNGNMVSGLIMIGVIPCTDERVILDSDKKSRAGLNKNIRYYGTVGKVNQSPECGSPNAPIKLQHARPLAVGYNQHPSPQAVKSPENIPQKSSRLTTRALQYMFGWYDG